MTDLNLFCPTLQLAVSLNLYIVQNKIVLLSFSRVLPHESSINNCTHGVCSFPLETRLFLTYCEL